MSSLAASVVIALNPHDNDPQRVIDAYALQTTAPETFEIIVVNSSGSESMGEAFARWRSASKVNVRALEIGRSGRASANNAGVLAARSELLVFMADDFIPCPTLVRAHVEFHRRLATPRAVGIGPAFFPDALREDPFRRWLEDSGRLFAVAFRIAGTQWPQGFFYAGNASLRKTLFDELGGFEERFPHDLGDDFEFSLRLRRAGVRSHFLPKAVALHDHPVTLEERLAAMRRSGAAARLVGERHGAVPEWDALTGQPVAGLATAALEARAREQAQSTPATRAAHYQALLDLAFAQGYHAEAGTRVTA